MESQRIDRSDDHDSTILRFTKAVSETDPVHANFDSLSPGPKQTELRSASKYM